MSFENGKWNFNDKPALSNWKKAVIVLSVLASIIVGSTYLLKEVRRWKKQAGIETHDQSEYEKLKAISPLDLNNATYEQLRLLPRVNNETAIGIIEKRPIHSVEELDEVYGIGEKTLALLRPHVFVDQTTIDDDLPGEAESEKTVPVDDQK